MLGVEAGILLLQALEALHEQTGGGKEHDRERDLRDDKRAAEELRAAAGGATRAGFLERGGGIALGGGPRGERAEDESAREGADEGESEDRAIQLDRKRARQVGHEGRAENVDAPRTHQQTEQAAGAEEYQAFGYKQPDQPRATGAEGGADGEFAFGGDRAREEQAGDIGAADEERGRDATLNEPEHAANFADVALEKSGNAAAEARGFPEGRLIGQSLGVAGLDEIEFALDRFRGDAGFEPRDHVREFGAALVVAALGVGEDKRHPELHAGRRKIKRLGHHAHDDVRFAVEPDRAADDAGVGAEAVAPERVAEHDGLRGAEDGVFAREHASVGGAGLQRAEERRTGDQADDAFRLRAFGEVEALDVVDRRVGEALDLRAAIEEIGNRDAHIFEAEIAVVVIAVNEAVRVRPRVGLQKHRVDDREDRAIGADAERERENRDQAEGGSTEKCADGVAEIGQHDGKGDGGISGEKTG